MDDGLGAKIKIVPDYFQVSASSEDTPQRSTSSDQVSTSEDTPIRSALSNLQPRIDNQSWSRSPSWTGRKLKRAALMLNFFSLRSLPWSSGSGSEKIELTRAELESLRSETRY
ncbi:uncharacterized protein LOC126678704 [Mercurialis annua]|uniref:uncharacterized protein LOC126678704 n=1 Tax=Mercurialis annua TaxID=3986 RepID=UPI002160D67D|nr:uncharacterized protein LOC126678704 [Mercurialis annua]